VNPVFLGSLLLLAYDFAIEDFAPCDGQTVSTGYSSLYDLLGNQFGGDESEFGLPDLSGHELIPGLQYVIATRGISP
jgi:microcystin-dependent protein